MKEKRNDKLVILPILAVFSIPMSTLIPNSGIQNIQEHFFNVPYTKIALITTLPVLLGAVFSLVSARIAGRKVKVKPLIIFSLILFTIAGVGPFFFPDNLTFILILRTFYGISVGLLAPLGPTLIIKLIEDEVNQEKLMGAGSVTLNLSGVIYTTMAGFLADIDWTNMFLIYLVGMLYLIAVILFMPDIPLEVEDIDKTKTARKERVSPAMIGITLMCFIIAIIEYPVFINISPLIISENLGTAATAGIVLSMYTIGGIVGSAIYSNYKRRFETHTLPTSMLIVAGGFLVAAYSQSSVLLGVGTFLVGIAFGIYYPEFYMLMGKVAPVSLTTLGMSLIAVGYDLGVFASPYFYSILTQVTGQESIRFPFTFSTIAFGIIAIVLALFVRKKTTAETINKSHRT